MLQQHNQSRPIERTHAAPIGTEDDICWTIGGYWCDVVWSINGEWGCYFNNVKICGGLNTRNEAEQWLKSKSLNELVNLL